MTRSLPVGAESPGRAHIGVRTLREDRWWVQPLVTFVLLCLWVAYAMVRSHTYNPVVGIVNYFVPAPDALFGKERIFVLLMGLAFSNDLRRVFGG